MNVQFLGIILRVLRLGGFRRQCFITNQFQTTFAQEGGKGVKNPLFEVTVNSKEENFCPKYVQEFGLCSLYLIPPFPYPPSPPTQIQCSTVYKSFQILRSCSNLLCTGGAYYVTYSFRFISNKPWDGGEGRGAFT
jgi:hypothetical protein